MRDLSRDHNDLMIEVNQMDLLFPQSDHTLDSEAVFLAKTLDLGIIFDISFQKDDNSFLIDTNQSFLNDLEAIFHVRSVVIVVVLSIRCLVLVVSLTDRFLLRKRKRVDNGTVEDLPDRHSKVFGS